MIAFVPRNPHHSGMRHGGIRREDQVFELVKSVGLPVKRFVPKEPRPSNRNKKLLSVCRHSVGRLGFFPTNRRDIQTAAHNIRLQESYTEELSGDSSIRLVVLENTRDHLMMIPAAKRLNIDVICVPHDIESLSQSTCKHMASMWHLRPFWSEVRSIGQAKAFFSISFEEQWLMRGFGIEAEMLPYYPCSADLAALERIRRIRRGVVGNHILVLGSAGHPPTGRGMRDLLDQLSFWPDLKRNAVSVAGYGTEIFSSIPEANASIRVLGSVSESILEHLLISARVVVLNQWFGCGALTRIPDLLVAGVPVIANTIAARSYRQLDGVRTYSTASELYQLLREDTIDPVVPPRPLAAERHFRATILQSFSTL